jgi:hypothetical protein
MPQGCDAIRFAKMSRYFTFEEGSQFARVQCYLHDDSFAPQGWYTRAERGLELSRPFSLA